MRSQRSDAFHAVKKLMLIARPRSWVVLGLAFTVAMGARAHADLSAIDRFQSKPFRIDDRFQENTLKNYNPHGEVEWSTLKLSLNPQASIALTKTLAADFSLKLDLWPQPPKQGETSISEVFVKTTNGYGLLVNLARGTTQGRLIRQASAAMLRLKPGSGGNYEVVPLPELPAFVMSGEREEWTLRYNNGLLSIRCGKKVLGSVFLDAFSAWVTAIQIKQVAGEVELSRFVVDGSTTGYTDWQREEYAAINDMRAEADQLVSDSNYLAAIDLQQRVVAKGERAFGENDPAIALFLEDLASSQLAVRLYEPALENYERASEVLADRLGASHPQALLHKVVTANARIDARGPNSKLIKEMRDAIFGFQELAGVDKEGVLLSYFAGGAFEEVVRQNVAGNSYEGLRLLQDVLKLMKAVRENDRWDTKKCQAALDLQKRFIDSKGDEYEQLSKYFQLVELHSRAVRAGNELEAILARAELVSQSRLVFRENEPQIVDHLLANGSDLVYAGRIGEALTVLHEASDILDSTSRENRSKSNELSCRVLLASAYSQLGRFQDATDLFIEAEEILNKVGPDDKLAWAVFHLQVGRHLLDFGYDELALPRLGEATKSFFSAALYTSRGALESLELFSEALRSLGELEQSEKCAGQLRYLIEATFGKKCHAMARVLKLEGNLLFDRRDYATALKKYQQAYDLLMAFDRERSQTMLEVLTGQIQTHLQRRDILAAAKCFEKKLAYELEYRESAYDATSERVQALKSLQDLGSLDSLLIFALKGFISARRAYSHALPYKGSVTARQRSLRVLLQSPELQPLVDELSRIDLQLFASAGSAEVGGLERDLTALQYRRREIQSQLASANKSYRLASLRCDADDLQAALPADAVLVDYVEYIKPRGLGEELVGKIPRLGLAAFVVTPDNEVQLYDLGSADSAYDALTAWRMVMAAEPLYAAAGRGAEARASLNAWGSKLRKQVWDPFSKSIAGASTVIISPSLSLAQCPFAALPIGDVEKETFLIEHFALANIATPRLLPELLLTKPEAAQGGLLIAGDLDYGTARRKRWESDDHAVVFKELQGSEQEILPIRETYAATHPNAKATLLTRGEASESRIREEAPHYSWIHLSTHGFCLPIAIELDPPGEDTEAEKEKIVSVISGVALSGGNTLPRSDADPADNGILLADEIAALRLANTELVTLAACETALGAQIPGEGLLGAQRALHVAGARSSLTSLWAVEDASTRDLMVHFYDALWKKEMNKAVALQLSMTHMLRQHNWLTVKGEAYDSRTPPAAWAGFVLHGDWR